MAGEWKNCTKARPCPICHDLGETGHQRCAYTEDGAHNCFRAGGLPVPGWRIIPLTKSSKMNPGGTVYRSIDEPRVLKTLSPEELERRRAKEAEAERVNIAKAKSMWAICYEPEPLLEAYLRGRGIDVSLLPGGLLPRSLRWAKSIACWLENPDNPKVGKNVPGPAVVCAGVDKAGQIQCVHRIYLDPATCAEGTPKKRKLDNAKRLLGPARGAAVRLRSRVDETMTETLVICEGVETGVALMAFTGFTVFACISGGGMRAVELDPRDVDPETGGIKRIIVAGDLDSVDERTQQRPGTTHAAIAANRLRSLHPNIPVVVAMPTHTTLPELVNEGGDAIAGKGVDWEDVLRELGPARAAEAFAAACSIDLPTDAPDAPVASGGEPGGPGDGEQGTGGGVPGGERGPILPEGDLLRARTLAEAVFTPPSPAGERFTVLYDFKGQRWLKWNGTCYDEVTDDVLVMRALEFYEQFVVKKVGKGDRKGEVWFERAAIGAHTANQCVEALKSPAGVTFDDVPSWTRATLDADGRPEWRPGPGGWRPRVKGRTPSHVFPVKNGLLNLDAWVEGRVELLPHTPRYISTNCTDYELDVELLERIVAEDPHLEGRGGELVAKACPTWMKVVSIMSGDDPVWIECLGRSFAACLTSDISMERIYFMPGPPGSFKSTTGEAIIAMLGRNQVATTDLARMCDKFEVGYWRGFRVAMMTDANVGKNLDAKQAVEMIKRFSGGDPMAAEQKHRAKNPFFRPNMHLWIMANDLLSLPDPSLSLGRRLVCMPTKAGETKRADPKIKQRVKTEGAGILVWALVYLRALAQDRKAGRAPFVMSTHGQSLLDDFARLSSRVHAFMQDCCRIDETAEVSCGLLRRIYAAWCEDQGVNALSDEVFGTHLKTLVVGLDRANRTMGEGMSRFKVYRGLRLAMPGEQLDQPITAERRGAKVYHDHQVAEFGFVEGERRTTVYGSDGPEFPIPS